MLSECLSEYRREMRVNKDRIEKKARLLALLESETGLDLINDSWDLRCDGTFEVKLADIHSIKKCCGEFKPDTGKEICNDYDETGEIWIHCTVADGIYSGWTFRYRHWLSPNEPCKVEEKHVAARNIPSSSYKALTCPRNM